MYEILCQAVRGAALLHDIGYPPCSHIVEFALNTVYEEECRRVDSENRRQKEFLEIMDRFYSDEVEGEEKKERVELHAEMGNDTQDRAEREDLCGSSPAH